MARPPAHSARTERDCTAWAHERLRLLFAQHGLTATAIDGDVSINQRKGRVRPLFDLDIAFTAAAAPDASGRVSDFTADAQAPCDLAIAFSGPGRDAVCASLAAILARFKDELLETHGHPLLVDAPPGERPKVAFDAPVPPPPAPSPTPTGTATASIDDQVQFSCSPLDLFAALTDAARIAAWSRAPALPAIIMPGTPFVLFDGNVRGRFTGLVRPSAIDLEWQLASWAAPSSVHLAIEPEPGTAGTCLLRLRQDGIPSGQEDMVRSNWHQYYWGPIKRVFGYGTTF